MRSISTSNMEDNDADVVVVGGGGSGLSAALAAAECGVKVIVLEKRRVLGGNSVFAEGLFAAESPAQKRMMIDARREDLFKIAMDYSHWKINPKVIRAFIDKSGDTINWLENKGLSVKHIDAIVICEAPKILPHVPKMKKNIAAILKIPDAAISIKGKTNEGIGAIGEGKAIAAWAVCEIE